VANGVMIKNEPDSYFYYTKGQYKDKEPNSANPKKAKFGINSEVKRS
jgi:hypothetical protein